MPTTPTPLEQSTSKKLSGGSEKERAILATAFLLSDTRTSINGTGSFLELLKRYSFRDRLNLSKEDRSGILHGLLDLAEGLKCNVGSILEHMKHLESLKEHHAISSKGRYSTLARKIAIKFEPPLIFLGNLGVKLFRVHSALNAVISDIDIFVPDESGLINTVKALSKSHDEIATRYSTRSTFTFDKDVEKASFTDFLGKTALNKTFPLDDLLEIVALDPDHEQIIRLPGSLEKRKGETIVTMSIEMRNLNFFETCSVKPYWIRNHDIDARRAYLRERLERIYKNFDNTGALGRKELKKLEDPGLVLDMDCCFMERFQCIVELESALLSHEGGEELRILSIGAIGRDPDTKTRGVCALDSLKSTGLEEHECFALVYAFRRHYKKMGDLLPSLPKAPDAAKFGQELQDLKPHLDSFMYSLAHLIEVYSYLHDVVYDPRGLNVVYYHSSLDVFQEIWTSVTKWIGGVTLQPVFERTPVSELLFRALTAKDTPAVSRLKKWYPKLFQASTYRDETVGFWSDMEYFGKSPKKESISLSQPSSFSFSFPMP